MPGSPITRKTHLWLDKQGGLEWVFDQVASGVSLTQIGKMVPSEVTGREEPGVSRETIRKYVWRGGERRVQGSAAEDELAIEAYKEASKVGAAGLVEQAQEIVDTADGQDGKTSVVQAAASRAKLMTWRAARQDRETWGDQPQNPTIHISLNDISLDAMRELGGPPKQIPADQVKDADFEILSDGPDAA